MQCGRVFRSVSVGKWLGGARSWLTLNVEDIDLNQHLIGYSAFSARDGFGLLTNN